ncbi:hypothetical protein SESBI_16431 [Sesbania bispinosa]|nr:hypothetical protein SESBI_16431 [Sesbania bispinosa]
MGFNIWKERGQSSTKEFQSIFANSIQEGLLRFGKSSFPDSPIFFKRSLLNIPKPRQLSVYATKAQPMPLKFQ